MSMTKLEKMKDNRCQCGKVHTHSIDDIIVGSGAIESIAETVNKYGRKAFVLCDKNTYSAAAKRVCEILSNSNIAFTSYILDGEKIEPDEVCVGAAVMHYDTSCDVIVAVGSGVINDIGKLLASTADKPYIIVATAPSMDGYASATSSMTRDGLKISLSTKCADVIIGDTNILAAAPMQMLVSGLGDMIAKYVSICEWRISHLITGEYYCEQIADLVRSALKKCTDRAKGLIERDPKAVEAVFEGLIIGGVAMTYAGLSRPASGIEHYISHIWDMRGVEFGTPTSTHGIQCAIGTLIALHYYERLKTLRPNAELALAHAQNFDLSKWHSELRTFLGKGAESMIKLDKTEQKYDIESHNKRLKTIIENWDNILTIINEELPSSDDFESLLDTIGSPKTPESIGLDSAIVPMTLAAAKDIRDKYVLPRLLWDIGEEI